MTVTKHYCDACNKEIHEYTGHILKFEGEISYFGTSAPDKKLAVAVEFCNFRCMADWVLSLEEKV